MVEPRAHPRVYLPLDAGVYIKTDEGKTLGPVRVIGMGGLFFQTDSPFVVGSSQTLELAEEPEHTAHKIQVVVRHVDKIGVGLQFQQLPPETKEHVENLVCQYLLSA
ncbi:MAG: PilZ domain-containing protein [Candidatus Korobacteraceae bacterium]